MGTNTKRDVRPLGTESAETIGAVDLRHPDDAGDGRMRGIFDLGELEVDVLAFLHAADDAHHERIPVREGPGRSLSVVEDALSEADAFDLAVGGAALGPLADRVEVIEDRQELPHRRGYRHRSAEFRQVAARALACMDNDAALGRRLLPAFCGGRVGGNHGGQGQRCCDPSKHTSCWQLRVHRQHHT